MGRSHGIGHGTRRKARIALWLTAGAVAVLALTATVALLFVSAEVNKARVSHAKVAHTMNVLRGVESLAKGLLSAQSLERAYVITGDTAQLAPYFEAERAVGQALRELEQEIEDSHARDLRARIADLAAQQLGTLRYAVALRSAGAADAAVQLVRRNLGTRQIEEISALIAALEAREKDLLGGHLSVIATQSTSSERIARLALYASIVLVLVATVMLFRYDRQRRRAERVADDTFHRLRDTLNSITQGVAVFDARRRLIAWNGRFCELAGLEPDAVFVGAAALDLLRPLEGAPGQEPAAAGRVAALATGAADVDTESRVGETALQVAGRTMSNDEYVVTLTDVSALKQSELAFREQAVRLRSTLDSIQDAIITINESGSIESWSGGAEAMFGYTADEVMRRSIALLMPEPFASAHASYLRAYVETGVPRVLGQRRELDAVHKDGHRFPIELAVSEMNLGARRLFIGSMRDISIRRQVDQLKAGFVSTVSHELRTPLTSISGALGLLASGATGALSEKATRMVRIAQANSDRLIRLINDILDLDKVESGRLEMNVEPHCLRAVVEQAIELNQEYAGRLGVRLEVDADSEDASVSVDRDRLLQVLTNLISNAAKFSPANEVVRIRTCAGPKHARVEIADRGPGISEEFRGRIFQKFAQADSTDRRSKGGTGLGLSIAKQLIERMHGSIGFSSEPGQGTRFFISMPVHRWVDAPPLGADGSGPSVLLCEDDPDVAHELGALLRGHGIDSEAVASIRDARVVLSRSRFAAAVIDLDLADGSGWELIEEIRRDPRCQDLPIVVSSAHSVLDANVRRGLDLHRVRWLPKPVDKGEFLRTVYACIRGVAAEPVPAADARVVEAVAS